MKEIKTSIGSIALQINAGEIKADKQEDAGKLAAKYILFHSVPAKVFNKESGRTRDEKYSSDLQAAILNEAKNQLSVIFENVQIEGSEKIIIASKIDAALKLEREKAYKGLIGLLPEEKLKELYPEFFAKEEEKPSEESAEE